MAVNCSLQMLIAVYHIILVVAIIAGEVGTILFSYEQQSMIPFFLLTAILPLILFITVCVISKCNWQNMCLLLVHFNPIFNLLWFIAFFPVFVHFCYTNYSGIFYPPYITGLLSLSSAIFVVREIWKYIQTAVLSARSVEREPVDAVGRIQLPYETPVTFTDLNGIRSTCAT